jgi:hypothetical protein
MPVAKDPQLPDFIIIGTMKGGTSSLFYYAGLHPQIALSKKKEVDFFLDHNWSRVVQWYKSFFAPSDRVKGEASPNLSKFPSSAAAPGRIASLLPDVKLIYLLREPVSRIESHLHHNLLRQRITVQQIENLQQHPDIAERYLLPSRYHLQLCKYLEHFPRERILILTSERLRSEPAQQMSRFFEFVGVDPGFRTAKFQQARHVSARARRWHSKSAKLTRVLQRLDSRKLIPGPVLRLLSEEVPRPKLSEATRAWLREQLQDDTLQLKQLTGDDFPEWG